MIVTYQYLSPNVLFEPPTTFRAGSPDLYPLNSVTFLQEQQVYIVRTAQGFYAVSRCARILAASRSGSRN